MSIYAPYLPDVTSSDNGKIAMVVEGYWDKVIEEQELPSVSASDNGKILKVVNGAWNKGDEIQGGADIPITTAWLAANLV